MKIEMTTTQAATVAKALKPAIGKDPVRYHLMQVEIAPTATGTRFVATDGYRCHEVTVAATVTEQLSEPIYVDGKDLVKYLAAAAKEKTPVELSVGDGLTVKSGNGHVNLALHFVTFPNMDQIFSQVSEVEGNAAFNGDYFADLMLSASAVAGKDTRKEQRPVKIVSINPRKCSRVEAMSADTDMIFTGVIMPMRQ